MTTTDTEPDTEDDAALRLQLLEAIERQDLEVRNARRRVNELRDDLKAARGDHQAALAELQRLAGARSGELPLFDVLHPDAADPFEQAVGDDWEAVTLAEVLTSSKHSALLEEHGLHTLGELAAFTRDGKRLTDVDGIGAVASERIEDDLLAFWRAQAALEADLEAAGGEA